MSKYRVIQWATGYTARQVVQAMAERPEYEIVGGRVYDKNKVGRDLGEICSTRMLGVKATSNNQEILDIDADCVIYMASAEFDLEQSLKDVCSLLESGKNVVTTSCAFIYPKALRAGYAEEIEAACQKGKTTFHGLGIMPGFISEAVPLMLTRIMRRVDQLSAYETLLYKDYPSHAQMFDLMGFGFEPDDPTPLLTNLEFVGATWRPSALLVANAVGLKVDEVQNFRETKLATEDFQVAAGLIRKGTVAAMNFGVRVISEGQPVIVMQHYTRMDERLAPEWPRGDGWTVVFEGLPSMSMKINVGIHGEDHTDQACWNTAMHAVHAVPYVIDARPGIMTLDQVPPVWGVNAFRRY